MIKGKTHLVGTLRTNRKVNPSESTNAKLNRGDIIVRQNQDKTIVLKWKDKRDVLMLNTKHGDSVTTFMKKAKNTVSLPWSSM